jgi:LacI family transcriptional regulator
MMVTQKQIAEKMGVSQRLVSYALKGDGTVSEKMREEIRLTALAMGYRPNNSARAIRTGKFGTVALLINAGQPVSSLLEHLLDGIHDELAAHDMHLLLVKLRKEELSSDETGPRLFRELMVDGLLIALDWVVEPEMAQIIRRHNIPSIWLNANGEHDCVRPDDEGAGSEAVRHFLKLGHRRIAYVTTPHQNHYSVLARERGYESAMNEAGLMPQVLAADNLVSRPEHMAVARSFLAAKPRPTAMIFYVGATLSATTMAAVQAGLTIPDDLSVLMIGHGGHYSPLVQTDILTVPFRDIGRCAVQQLLRKIEQPDQLLPTRVLPAHFDWATPARRHRALKQDSTRISPRDRACGNSLLCDGADGEQP